jgi:hypothetical protein
MRLVLVGVVHAKCDPVVVAEGKLINVAVEVALADMVGRGIDAALENREKPFGRTVDCL